MSPLRRAALVLLSSVFVPSACSDLGPDLGDGGLFPAFPSVEHGSVRVVATTTGPDPDLDGYQVTVDSFQTAPVPPNGEVVFHAVVAGARTVRIDGLSPNCTAAEPATRTITVQAGQLTDLRYTVTCAPLEDGAVSLFSPAANAIIAQMAPSPDCGDKPGFRISFDWSDARHPAGVSGYNIHVQHEDASLALVDAVVPSSRADVVRCGYVIDANLAGWRWRVRALVGGGGLGPWSEARPFRFAPCRTVSGATCQGG